MQVPHSYCYFSLLLLNAVLSVELMPVIYDLTWFSRSTSLEAKVSDRFKHSCAAATAMHKLFCPVCAVPTAPSATTPRPKTNLELHGAHALV